MLQKLIAPLALMNKKDFLTFLMLISFIYSYSQITINAPTLGFSQVCASPTFNSYNLSFSFSPTSNLGTGNTFTVELSNATGSFTNPTVLTTTNATTSPVNVTFPFPTSVNGTNYRIRIKSSAPSSTSPSSIYFPANYAVYNQPFTINNNVQNQPVCGSSSYILSVDNGANSPLQFSQLVYKWYRNNVVIAGETSPNLSITQPGNYYVRVDYGTCSLNAYSNIVTITFTQTETLTISTQGNATNICPATGLLISSAINGTGYTYQWYKDGNLIPGATNATYNVNAAGEYYLIASKTGCNFTSNTLIFTENSITASLDSGTEINLLSGQTKILSTTTNALNPTYKWYKNNVLMVNQTSSSLTVTQIGNYKAIVKQNTGCLLEKEVTTIVSSPASYDLTIKHSTGYADCENNTETLSIDAFRYNSTLGSFDVPSSIPLIYKWYKNNVQIVGANMATYTVPNNSENGNYKLEVSFANNESVSSNNLDVKLKIDETLTISSDGGYLCSSNTGVTLTSSVINPIYDYQWFEEGDDTIVLGTNTTYTATETGNYYLVISLNGCNVTSNTIVVGTIDETLMTTNYDSEIFITEGEEITIIASGADSYEWYINGNLINTTEELTINQETIVELIGIFNGCQITKDFTISYSPQIFNTVIPNTITPNSDGKNDTWILTEDFAYKSDVEIVIFSSNQQVVFRTTDYQNNWPLEPIIKKNKMFYYKIIKNNLTLLQGTISVIQ